MAQIYERGHYSFLSGAQNLERNQRFIELLTNLDYVHEKTQNTYKLTLKGKILLAEYGISEKPFLLRHKFITNYNGKIEWFRSELLEFQKQFRVSDEDMERTLDLGEDYQFFRCIWGSNYLPRSLTITLLGEHFAKSPEDFQTYVRLDERVFKNQYSDKVLLDWIALSANSTEDFEIEYKKNTPREVEIRELVACFANHLSGIIAIGFKNDGTLSGIFNPDAEEQKVHSAIRRINDLDVRFRVVENKSGLRGLIILIARSKKTIIIGNKVLQRSGSIKKELTPAQAVELANEKQKGKSGHLWIKSLKKFKHIKYPITREPISSD